MNKWNYTKKIAGSFTLAASIIGPSCQPQEVKQPNIILFLVDDMGWQDTSVPFWDRVTPLNKKFHTPNMDRLAAQGMKFTQAYASSVCSPTRVSMITGLNAARHRVTNFTLHRLDDINSQHHSDTPHPQLNMPSWNCNGLSPVPGIPRTVHAKTLPQWLSEAGYHNIHIGKAHLGAIGTPGEDPLNLGFHVNIAGHAPGGPGSYLGENNYSAVWRNAPELWDVPHLETYHGTDTFLTEALTLEALKTLDQARETGKPFFMHMSHYAPHVPYEKDERYYMKYRDAGLDHFEAMYAALIEGMDKSLGDIMDYLEKNNLADHTVILFYSDNGGVTASNRGGEFFTHNLPLSSGKCSAHEGGIRVPMIVKWPGVVQAGTTCDDVLIAEDFFPTLLEIAGVADREAYAVDGVSFMPMLRGRTGISENRALFWHYPNSSYHLQGPGHGTYSIIRQDDWKYIFYYDPEREVREELFNIREDIGENNNLAQTNHEKLKELRQTLKDYLSKVDAQFPTDKITGEIVRIP